MSELRTDNNHVDRIRPDREVTSNRQSESVSRVRFLPFAMAMAAIAPSLVTFCLYFIYVLFADSESSTLSAWSFYLRGPLPFLLLMLLEASLVWAMSFSHIERGGPQSVAHPWRTFWVCVVLYVVGIQGMVLHHALPFYLQIGAAWLTFRGILNLDGLMMMVGGPFARVLSLAILLLCCWFALRLGRGTETSPPGSPARLPKHYVVPVACAVFYVTTQWALFGTSYAWLASSGVGALHYDPALWISGVGSPVLFVLALAGAWVGAGRPSQVRPWRTLGASLLTQVLQLLICCVIGLICLALVLSGDFYSFGMDDIAVLVVFVAALNVLLLPFLIFWATRLLYRHLQSPRAICESASYDRPRTEAGDA